MRVLRWLVVLALSCGGSQVRPDPLPVAQGSPPAPAPVAWLLDGLRLLPELSVADASGARFTAGPMRVELADGAARVAADVFSSRITVAARCGDGWVFATSDGLIARASDFLARPRAVGMLGPAAGHRFREESGHAIWQHAGLAYVGPCDETPRRISVNDGDTILDASVSDAGWLAVTSGGALHQSSDRGASWRRIDAGGAVAQLSGANVRVGARWLAIAADGTTTAAQAPADLTRSPSYPSREAIALVYSALLPLPHVRIPGVAASNGVWSGERAFVALQGEPAQLARLEPNEMQPLLRDRECTGTATWGSAVATVCENQLFVSDDVEHFVATGIATGEVDIVLTPSGSVILGGPCTAATVRSEAEEDEEEYEEYEESEDEEYEEHEEADPKQDDPRSVVCVVERGGDRTEHTVPLRDARILDSDAHGRVLLFAREGLHVWEMGSERAIALPGERRAWARASAPKMAADGTLFGWIPEENGARAFVAEPPRYEPRWLALPERAQRIGFTDRGFGVGLGDTLADVWTSADTGRTWERLAIAVDGEPHAVTIGAAEEGVLACDLLGCWSRDVIYVERNGTGAPPRYAAPPSIAEPYPTTNAPWLSCEPGAPSALRWETDDEEARQPGTFRNVGVHLSIESRGAQTRFVLRAEDARGEHTMTSAWARTAALGDDPSECRPQWIGRGGALLGCANTLLWITDTRAPRVIDRPDGVSLRVFEAGGGEHWLHTDRTLVVLDAEGRERARHTIAPQHGIAFGRRGRDPVRIVETPSGLRAVLLREPGAVSIAVPELPRVPAICDGDDGEWVIEMRGRFRTVEDWMEMDASMVYRDGAWCIARARSHPDDGPQFRGALIEVAASATRALDGVMESFQRSTLTCTPVEPAR
jgi:hypothetical protein